MTFRYANDAEPEARDAAVLAMERHAVADDVGEQDAVASARGRICGGYGAATRVASSPVPSRPHPRSQRLAASANDPHWPVRVAP
jgi:hypothetical protein